MNDYPRDPDGSGASNLLISGNGSTIDARPSTSSVRAPRTRSTIVALSLSIAAVVLAIGGISTSIVAFVLHAQEIDAISNSVRAAEHAAGKQDGEISAIGERVSELERHIEDETQSKLDVKLVYKEVLPSIVTVYCGNGLGTGFAYESQAADGYKTAIITNNHVIEKCTYSEASRTVAMKDSNGASITGYVYGWDTKNDLATIQTKVSLPTLSEASEAEIGDPVIAVGSPQGLSNTVTRGIVSNIYSDAYQTDAAINHGNSGGPLLDRAGRVLGVTTFALDREGLNVAIRTVQFCAEILIC